MENNSCRLALSYPDISNIAPDIRIAALLYDAYAGRYGELSAISDYTYQSIMLKDDMPLLSELLECISITEMEHFKMLGNAIRILGSNPIVKTHIKGIEVNQAQPITNKIEKILLSNIENEKRAAAYYKKVALHTKETDLVLFLKRLAADEEHHAMLFSDILNKL